MTLVISCVTRNHAIQVSDRRLVWSTGNLKDDDTNKAVLFCGRVAFAYTGVAELQGKRTDVWLTEVLATRWPLSLSDAVRLVAEQATGVFRRARPGARLKRHAFVGVGWTKSAEAEPYRPILCRIANFYGRDGTLLDEAQEAFSVQVFILREADPYALLDVGQPLLVEETEYLNRSIRKCAERGVGPLPIARVIAETVRRVASRNSTVGQNLLVTSLPKAAVQPQGFFVAAAPPGPETLSFLYLPAGVTDGTQYGPNFVCGGSAWTDFRSGPIVES